MDRIMILKGDCIEVMKAMRPNSMDAIVCDPPYGLEFMGKKWDKLGKINSGRSRMENEITAISRGPETYQSGIEMQLWHAQWLTEAYRVLKPGGSMLVMGGTRTFHRLACAIEDSGFIIKDTLMWLYGSGFPKAQDLGKMIDKRAGKERKIVGSRHRNVKPFDDKAGWNPNDTKGDFDYTAPSTDLAKHWDGFKVGGLKPAYEPIVWAVKPPEGSYMDNVLKWGVGAVNVDECRVEHNGNLIKGGCTKYGGMFGNDGKVNNPEGNAKGRFPANVILDEEAGRMLDEQSGASKSKECNRGNLDDMRSDNYHRSNGARLPNSDYKRGHNDSGGASRFFYCAKASKSERGKDNKHPTVKPIKLFEYLIKLVTREGQIVLDPFMGSGTTAIAAHNTGRKCVGIEKEDEYLKITTRRISYWQNQPKQNSLNLGE